MTESVRRVMIERRQTVNDRRVTTRDGWLATNLFLIVRAAHIQRFERGLQMSPTKILITSINVFLGTIQLLFETFLDIINTFEDILDLSLLGDSACIWKYVGRHLIACIGHWRLACRVFAADRDVVQLFIRKIEIILWFVYLLWSCNRWRR